MLHLVEKGDPAGTPILFLHGFPDFHYGWRRQVPFFAGHGYRVLTPDLLGYGKSEKPRALDRFRLNAVAREVLDLLDARGIETCHLVGHDWGASLSWVLLNEHPERFRTGTVICVPPHPVFQDFIVHNRHGQTLRSFYMALFQLPWMPEKLVTARDGRVLAGMLRKSSRPGTFTDADLALYRDAWREPGAPRAMFNWYRANIRKPPDRADVDVKVPMLILWGDRDSALDHHMAEASLAHCRDGRVQHFPEGTHWVHAEFPEAVNAAIHAFVAEQ